MANALDVSQYTWAGGLPSTAALNYAGSKAENGNPFRSNSQEFQQYEQRYASQNTPQAGYDDSAVRAAQQQYQNDVQANINTVDASRPITEAKFATTAKGINNNLDYLKQSYETALQSLSQKENKQLTDVERSTRNLYGGQGLHGFMQDNAVQTSLDPIREGYATQRTATTQSRDTNLNSLTNLLEQNTNDAAAADNALQQLKAQIRQGADANQVDYALKSLGLSIDQRKTAADQLYRDAALDVTKQQNAYTQSLNPADIAAQLKQAELQYYKQAAPYNQQALQAALGLTNAQTANYQRQANGVSLGSGGSSTGNNNPYAIT